MNELTNSDNPYLGGNFKPVDDESMFENLSVIGQIPTDMAGIYIRNGPNPRFPPKGKYHWFDGDGMIHAVQIENGKANYYNRYIETQAFKYEAIKSRAVWRGLTNVPSIIQLLFPPDGLRIKNPANTSVVWHADKLLALWEVGEPYVLDLPGIETVGQLDFNLAVGNFTAHPKIDPTTKEMIFFGMKRGRYPTIQYGIADSQCHLSYQTSISIPSNVFMHDFAITKNYTIFMDLPYEMSMRQWFKTGTPFIFNSKRPARFGVMPRYGTSSDIIWFEDEPCFVYHTMNAYEMQDAGGTTTDVILIASRMNRGVIGEEKTNDAVKEDDIGRLHKWAFNLETGQLKGEQLNEIPSDFPRFNDSLMGNKNRYGYTSTVSIDVNSSAPYFTSTIKHDFQTGSLVEHRFGEFKFGGESVFVPRNADSMSISEEQTSDFEDDGWLLNYIYDANKKTSELVIIDAKAIDSEPVARVKLPRRVPYGFHGVWIPAKDIARSNS